MKKIILVLAIIMMGVSCKKENIAPNGEGNIDNTENCLCGVIVQETTSSYLTDGDNGSPGVITMYDNYKVRNDCSGNVKWFNDAKKYNFTNDVGNTFCYSFKW